LLQSGAVTVIRCGRFQPVTERAAWSAAIAQLVEHVIRNDGVTGSNPVCGTSTFLNPKLAASVAQHMLCVTQDACVILLT
jgi:hypothetical protein